LHCDGEMKSLPFSDRLSLFGGLDTRSVAKSFELAHGGTLVNQIFIDQDSYLQTAEVILGERSGSPMLSLGSLSKIPVWLFRGDARGACDEASARLRGAGIDGGSDR
jgi:hypothetical protein